MLFRVFTIAAVIALVVSTWILSSPARRPKAQTTRQQADFPGYYLKNAVLTDYALSGDPSIRIEAERIDQVAHGNDVALHNVKVDYQAPNGQSWVMVGDVARVQLGGTVVDVTGNVRLQGSAEAEGTASDAVIYTDMLSYNIPNAVASTSSDIRIDFAQHTLSKDVSR